MSFKRFNAPNLPPGSRISNRQTGVILTCSGVESLDSLVGGGLPVGSLTLIETSQSDVHGLLLTKYFVSQGIDHNHGIFLCAQDSQSQQKYLSTLPSVVVNEKPSETINDMSKLKIAWRYQNQPKVTSVVGKNVAKQQINLYQSSFDALQYMPVPENVFQFSHHSKDLDDLYSEIEKIILDHGFTNPLIILRIVLIDCASLLWSSSATKFMMKLKILLRQTFACCVFLLPKFNIEKPILRILEYIADCVINVETFVSNDQTTVMSKDMHGLFYLIKPFRLQSLNVLVPDTKHLGFRSKRKEFLIEKLHLPPDEQKFETITIYETKSRFFLIGEYAAGLNGPETSYRVLKVDRESTQVIHDATLYDRSQISQLILMMEQGNKNNCKRIGIYHCLLGFVKVGKQSFILVVTERSPVALLGSHYVFHIDGTAMIPITSKETTAEENAWLDMFKRIDLSKNFYYSLTWNLVFTVQQNSLENISVDRAAMFVWNNQFWKEQEECKNMWGVDIIHGFVDQAKISLFGSSLYLTLIARRSCLFAGTRYLKRGITDKGYVANEVETEQILHDANISVFDLAKKSSFVQHRGSIPLFWGQDLSGLSPKPSIFISRVDPMFAAAAKHFQALMERHGPTIVVLNLVKQREKTPRESVLYYHYTECIDYLNQFLKQNIEYHSFDMARAAKSDDQDVIGHLESLSSGLVKTCGWYSSHFMKNNENLILQKGIIRTNCVDCLDRTNAAQFMIGISALGHQLCSLGFISDPFLNIESDAGKLLMEMYHDHGDTIALQYGGSQLVNTMESYRKTNAWTSHSRDLINSIRRYVSNSFTDNEKQESMNAFLGLLSFPVREIPSDYSLHFDFGYQKNNYLEWHDESKIASFHGKIDIKFSNDPFSSWIWSHYYASNIYSSFSALFAFRIMSTFRVGKDLNDSPFTSRSKTIKVNVGSNIESVTLSGEKVGERIQEEKTEPISTKPPLARKNSISDIVNILTNPVIPSKELREYQSYLNEKTLLTEVDPVFYGRYVNTSLTNALPEKDRMMYHHYTTNSAAHIHSATRSKTDVYSGYVRSSSQWRLFLPE